MAGPIPQSAETLLTSAVTISANSTHTEEYDSGQCYEFELWVDMTTNGSATEGVEIRLKRKTGSGGTKGSAPWRVKTVDVGQSNYVSYLGAVPPGTMDIEVENKDGTYDATLNQIYVRKAS